MPIASRRKHLLPLWCAYCDQIHNRSVPRNPVERFSLTPWIYTFFLISFEDVWFEIFTCFQAAVVVFSFRWQIPVQKMNHTSPGVEKFCLSHDVCDGAYRCD